MWWIAASLSAEMERCAKPSETTAYLVTAVPGANIPTSFGHSALLVYRPEAGGRSPVYDHGHYDPSDPWFPVDYALQRADYWGEKRTLNRVQRSYAAWRRDLIAQPLLLEPRELEALVDDQERLTDGTPFRYQWYERNCTTRIRDSIDRALGGGLRRALAFPTAHDVRNLVLGHAAGGPLGPVLAWGAGARASRSLTGWEASFLPVTFMEGLAEARRPDGRPLAGPPCLLGANGGSFPPLRAPDYRGSFARVGLGIALALVASWPFPRAGRAVVALFGLALLTIAAIDLFGGAVGAGAPWWTHHNQALANPLALGLIAGARGWRRARPWVWLQVGIATVAALWAAVCGFPNHDAPAVALVLPGLWMSVLHLERAWRDREIPSAQERG